MGVLKFSILGKCRSEVIRQSWQISGSHPEWSAREHCRQSVPKPQFANSEMICKESAGEEYSELTEDHTE
jgi:hypothetical protein